MPALNRIILVGNLTRDPEVKFLPSGSAHVGLGLAVSHKYKTKDGAEKEEVCFVTCDAFGKTAENCGKYLAKGSLVLIEGRLKFEQWEKDGQKRSAHKVTVERIQFLSQRKAEEDYNQDTKPAASPAEEAAKTGAVDDSELPF